MSRIGDLEPDSRWVSLLLLVAVEACGGQSKATDGAQEFTLHVFGPDGKVVNDATVSRHEPAGHDVILEFGSAVLDGESYRVRLTPGIDREIPLTVSSRFGAAKLPIPAPGTDDVTVRFRRPGTIDLAIRGIHGDPSKYLVFVTAAGEGPSDGYYEGSLDPENTLAETSFQPGMHDLTVVRHTQGYEPLLSERVRIDAGENRLAYRLPTTYDATILLPEKAHGRFVAAVSETGTSIDADHEKKDRFEYEGLLPGTYYFVLEGDGDEDAMAVRLAASGLVEFRPSRIDAIRVNLSPLGTENDPLATAGFQDGDRILAIGGQGFASWREALSMLGESAASPEVRVTLLRGDQQLELTVSGTLLGEAKDLTPANR
jgi:hypothetical protein